MARTFEWLLHECPLPPRQGQRGFRCYESYDDGVQLKGSPNGYFMVHHYSESLVVVEVKSNKHLDPLFMKLKEPVLSKLNNSFSQGGLVFFGTKGGYVHQMLRIW